MINFIEWAKGSAYSGVAINTIPTERILQLKLKSLFEQARNCRLSFLRGATIETPRLCNPNNVFSEKET